MQNETGNTSVRQESASRGPSGIVVGLIVGLVIALAGIGFLWKRSNDLTAQIAAMQDGTQAQISKLSDATTSLLEQRLASLDDKISAAMKDSATNMNSALKQTRTLATHQTDELRSKLDDERQQVSGELAQLKDASDSKFKDVSTNFDAVKADVTGVKAGVSSTQEGLDKTREGLDRTNADLKRVIGDMGTMSGLIATNAKDLEALRALGDRNYVEFNLTKGKTMQKVGDVSVVLKSADPKRNRYTVEILADDKQVQKSDRTINEPVQFYMSKSKQPYELVVNQVKKDEVVGYLSEPKVLVARQ
jgi:chromosome segregation ATPase